MYPATWGICQVGSGVLSDRWGRKPLIVGGMILQGLALLGVSASHSVAGWAVTLVALGIGTALVYPTLLAAVSDIARPDARAATVGVYRFWRDLGYAAGALLAGLMADRIGVEGAIAVVGALTVVSGLGVAARLSGPLQP